LLLMALLGGCAAHVSGLQQDASFTYAAVLQGRMAVVGVTELEAPLSAEDTSYYADHLLRDLRDERKHFPLVPAGRVREALGEDDYLPMLDRYRSHGVLAIADLRLLRARLSGVRYAAVARIEGNQVSRDHQESESEVTRYDKERKKEIPTGKVEAEVSFNVQRRISASLTVYDLTSGRAVWNGAVTQSRSRSNRQSQIYDRRDRDEQRLAAALVRRLLGERGLHNYPSPPATIDVLDAVFHGFGQNMPKKP